MAAETSTHLRALILSRAPELAVLSRSLISERVVTEWRRDLACGVARGWDAIVVVLGREGEGVELCRRARAESSLPIVAISEPGDEQARVLSLEVGADAALGRPFSARELAAQLRALARRGRRAASAASSAPVRLGDLEISKGDHAAWLNGRSLGLTTTEFAILRVLAEHAGGTLTRERILELTKGSTDEAFDRSIDVHISRLRHKLGDDPRDPRFVRTVRGKGYLLAAGPPRATQEAGSSESLDAR
jgi:two-component system, OmpR family, response regulator